MSHLWEMPPRPQQISKQQSALVLFGAKSSRKIGIKCYRSLPVLSCIALLARNGLDHEEERITQETHDFNSQNRLKSRADLRESG